MSSIKTSCFFLCFCFFIGLFGACRSDVDKLTPAELQHIDTLYTNHINKLGPELDSLCALREDSLIQIAVDSMIEVRMAKTIKQTMKRLGDRKLK